jgi:hypothetical protein
MNNNNNSFNNSGTNNALNLLSQQVLTLSATVNALQQTIGNNQAPVITCEQIEPVNGEARGKNVTLYIQFNV